MHEVDEEGGGGEGMSSLTVSSHMASPMTRSMTSIKHVSSQSGCCGSGRWPRCRWMLWKHLVERGLGCLSARDHGSWHHHHHHL